MVFLSGSYRSSSHPGHVPDVSFMKADFFFFFPFEYFSADPSVSCAIHRRAVNCTGVTRGIADLQRVTL